uniref:Zinc finger BED domain-containing protein RICESLEEPER 2 n=1 Tax=Tanacetum cinerariifolium TaxID=118510 RepID=A0A699IWP6_TANCI|nr:zinc finger BED domain-containing protein RICESLEEPER 2 [Tanacetum cinerariifolium]
MAMDLISVQSSSVASKSAFSTSERVLSIRRTRLTPASLEMCMCLNDHLDAKECKQDKCPLEIPLDFEEDVFYDEVQRNEAIPLSDEEIALDANASSEGTLSPGGPRGASSSRASGGNQMSRLLNRLQEHTKKKARNDPSFSFEYERYVNSDFVTLLDNSEFTAFDLLGFWKANESMFLVLSHMAMDIISVQATSVASESAFSINGMVLSIQRTRLTPASLEMCMCLTGHLDAKERRKHKSGLENPIDFEEEILDAEVQQNEAISLSEEEIALDVASSEGTMSGSGSGSGREEVDYDMTNYGYDYE